MLPLDEKEKLQAHERFYCTFYFISLLTHRSHVFLLDRGKTMMIDIEKRRKKVFFDETRNILNKSHPNSVK